MPFDNAPITETKPDVFSLEGLAAWLEKQNSRQRYWYVNPFGCLLFRYFRASGIPVESVIGECWFDRTGHCHALPALLDDVARPCWWPSSTYGAALARCRRLIADGEIA